MFNYDSKYIMTVRRFGKIRTFYFDSIREAYSFYLWNYSTVGDWFYYLRVAHIPLCCVRDSQVMTQLFFNCFKDVALTLPR